jgi:hypothetical protein
MNTTGVESRLGEALRGTNVHGPVPEAAIADAEKSLGASFPPSLRAFLARFGAALGQGFEVAGLPASDRVSPSEPTLWANLVKQTLQARSNKLGALPDNYLLLGNDGMDTRYLLVFGESDETGECPVVALGPGRNYVRVADSFIEFVERLSRGETP